MLVFEPTADYASIRLLLTEKRCWARMSGAGCPRSFEVGPRPDTEYVLAIKQGVAVAVFVVLDSIEVHFCFHPDVWGHTLPIAKAFLSWWWAHADGTVLIGPVPRRNRLALALAKRAGFHEYREAREGAFIYTYLQRPEAA